MVLREAAFTQASGCNGRRGGWPSGVAEARIGLRRDDAFVAERREWLSWYRPTRGSRARRDGSAKRPETLSRLPIAARAFEGGKVWAMGTRFNWDRCRPSGPSEQARPRGPRKPGGLGDMPPWYRRWVDGLDVARTALPCGCLVDGKLEYDQYLSAFRDHVCG